MTTLPLPATPKWVEYLPVGATLLLEYANLGQLHQMWTERTAAGQSATAWLAVAGALWSYAYYYHRKGLRVPFWTTVAGGTLNLAVVSTVAYFRFFA